MSGPAARYGVVAIVLHWAIAIAILANGVLGWWMHEALEGSGNRALVIDAYQVHKSLGLSVLALSLLRLAWRLVHRPPPLPMSMPAWERSVARLTHWVFYLLMIAIPLSGWVYVSAQWREGAALNVPTLWFGAFEVPHLFGLDQAPPAIRQAVANLGLEAHELLAWGAMLLLCLHVGAALKHHFHDRDEVLANMLPWADRRPSGMARRLGLGLGAMLILAGAGGVILALVPSGPPEARGQAAIQTLAGGWIIDPSASEVRFSGKHAGSPFTGRFTHWRAQVVIDEASPTASKVFAEIDTASATDGVKLHDETLPGREWFDVERHPQATFRSTAIQILDEGRYRLEGELRIKDRPIPIQGLELELDGDQARIHGEVEIRRADADLGMASDPDGEWVSPVIAVGVELSARRP